MAFSGTGDQLASMIDGLGADPLVLIIGIALVYLVLGMFLEPIGAMLLTLPIFLPVIEDAGMNKVWFGVLLAKFLEVGMITPPIGLNVFVIKSVVGDLVGTSGIFRGILWFLVADAVVIAALIAFPGIVLTLPQFFN